MSGCVLHTWTKCILESNLSFLIPNISPNYMYVLNEEWMGIFRKVVLVKYTAILKQAGSSRYGKEDPGYLRRWVQMIFSTFFFLNLAKKTQDI